MKKGKSSKAAAKPSELVWEDPPKDTLGNTKWARWIYLLRQNPGKWARLTKYKGKGSAVTSVSRIRMKYPDCEFLTTRNDVLYGRCKGKKKN